MKLLAIKRLLEIQSIFFRYSLDQFFFHTPLLLRILSLRYLLPWNWITLRRKKKITRGIALRLALQELGPIFVKLGQILSTRQDILPLDVRTELSLLQDHVLAFDSKTALKTIEKEFSQKIEDVFHFFDINVLASASIAQVHCAILKNKEDVVVKIVRPGIRKVIESDLAWLLIFAKVAEYCSSTARLLHLVDVAHDYEKTIYDELNLLHEAANTSQLRRNFENSPLLYVPKVYWKWCTSKVLVMERIHGIQVSDITRLSSQNFNMKLLAERGVEIFLTQVFSHSFFHADMHPGNIFINPSSHYSPQYIAIDCGIVGSLTNEDQDYLARNLIAFFRRDYRRVAQLHINSGWVSSDTKVNEFEAAIRTVCEPIFERPLKEISFGQLLMRLFQTARRFNMEVQPQLVLLQKTLLNIEALGCQLYPDLNLWKTAKPFLEKWMNEKLFPKSIFKKAFNEIEQLPRLINMSRKILEYNHKTIIQRRKITFSISFKMLALLLAVVLIIFSAS